LLKSKRQQLHQQIAQVLAERFSETAETQPELLAHHYTEAGLKEQAIPHWQKAGQRASQRSANMEAISHLTKGLELLTPLPDTPERVQQELILQLTLSEAQATVKGYAASEVEKTVLRAQALCQQLGETPQLIRVLQWLTTVRFARAEHHTARTLAEQCLSLAQSVHGTTFLPLAHFLLSNPLYALGEFALAYHHQQQSIAFSNPQKDPHSLMSCLSWIAWTLWMLGYPGQALQKSQEALALVERRSQPFSRAYALVCAAKFHLLRREESVAQERAEEVMTLSTEQGFPYWLANGMIYGGRALIEQEKGENGIEQLHEGLALMQASGAEFSRPYYLALLAEAYWKVGQGEKGLSVLAEALAMVNRTGERVYEAELYRLKGQLTLAQARVQSLGSSVQAEAEVCFLKAIDIARHQQARSLELRASTSLARLWQQQGKHDEAPRRCGSELGQEET
jgi:tetratricopeptide (TPR) repeat protein